MPESLTFITFVLSLASTAAIHFRDIPDPSTGARSEVNLDGAAQIIEILSLLDRKTRGNLTAEERQILEQVLHEVRLRFAEASEASGVRRSFDEARGRPERPAGRQDREVSSAPKDGGKKIIDH